MYKSRKKSDVLFAGIFVILGMWMILSVHCRAAEKNNDEKQSQISVSDPLKIPLIISIKTVSDEDMGMNSCRLCQAIPDGNLST